MQTHTHIYRQLKIFFLNFKENGFSWKNKRLYPAVLRSSSHYLSHLRVRAKCRCETKVLGSGAPKTSRNPESETSLEPGFPREKTLLRQTEALITALGKGCRNKLVFNLNTLIARNPTNPYPLSKMAGEETKSSEKKLGKWMAPFLVYSLGFSLQPTLSARIDDE